MTELTNAFSDLLTVLNEEELIRLRRRSEKQGRPYLEELLRLELKRRKEGDQQ
jgi:chromosome segregation and condensation protein ScpB